MDYERAEKRARTEERERAGGALLFSPEALDVDAFFFVSSAGRAMGQHRADIIHDAMRSRGARLLTLLETREWFSGSRERHSGSLVVIVHGCDSAEAARAVARLPPLSLPLASSSSGPCVFVSVNWVTDAVAAGRAELPAPTRGAAALQGAGTVRTSPAPSPTAPHVVEDAPVEEVVRASPAAAAFLLSGSDGTHAAPPALSAVAPAGAAPPTGSVPATPAALAVSSVATAASTATTGAAGAAAAGGGLNAHIIAELAKFRDLYATATNHKNDRFRVFAYTRVMGILKGMTHEVTDAETLRGVPGIGEPMRLKIAEIIATGTTRKLVQLQESPEIMLAGELRSIYGVGPVHATRLAALLREAGGSSVADLRRLPAVIESMTTSQRTGLCFLEDLKVRIPRFETEAILAVVVGCLQAVLPPGVIIRSGAEVEEHLAEEGRVSKAAAGAAAAGRSPQAPLRVSSQAAVDIIACGSYRRGRPHSGDVDFLICDRQGSLGRGLLERLVKTMRTRGVVAAELTTHVRDGLRDGTGCDSWMGIVQVADCPITELCRCVHRAPPPFAAETRPEGPLSPLLASVAPYCRGKHLGRRVDIKVYPADSFPFALMYFTGSAQFNQSVRLGAMKRGWTLSDKSLLRGATDSAACACEMDVFRALGLEYKAPHERDS